MFWKKSLIYFSLLCIMSILMIAAQAEISPEQTIVKNGKFMLLKGILNLQDNVYSLQTDSVKVKLLLAPEAYLVRRGADLDPSDTLIVSGFYSNKEMLVSTITEGKNATIIRSQIGTPYVISDDQKTWAANPATCIGCTLCTQHCPVMAIKMVKAKAITDSKKCISCGVCQTGDSKNWKGCPVKAQSQQK